MDASMHTYTKLKFLSVKWSYYKLWFLAVLCYRLYQYSFSHRLTQRLALCMEQKKPNNWCIQLIITLNSCFQMLKPMNTITLIYFLLFFYFLPMAQSSCRGSTSVGTSSSFLQRLLQERSRGIRWLLSPKFCLGEKHLIIPYISMWFWTTGLWLLSNYKTNSENWWGKSKLTTHVTNIPHTEFIVNLPSTMADKETVR